VPPRKKYSAHAHPATEVASLSVQKDKFEEIHFFGDKTEPGGNDYNIYDWTCRNFTSRHPKSVAAVDKTEVSTA